MRATSCSFPKFGRSSCEEVLSVKAESVPILVGVHEHGSQGELSAVLELVLGDGEQGYVIDEQAIFVSNG